MSLIFLAKARCRASNMTLKVARTLYTVCRQFIRYWPCLWFIILNSVSSHQSVRPSDCFLIQHMHLMFFYFLFLKFCFQVFSACAQFNQSVFVTFVRSFVIVLNVFFGLVWSGCDLNCVSTWVSDIFTGNLWIFIGFHISNFFIVCVETSFDIKFWWWF